MHPIPRSPGRRTTRAALALLLAAAPACGYPETAMQAQRARAAALDAQLRETRTQCEGRAAAQRALEARNATLADALRELGGNVQALETDRGALRSSVDELERARAELEAERATLRSSLAEARGGLEAARAREAQARERSELFRAMLERFRAMIASGELTVRIVRNRMVVTLPEGVLFDTGRAELKASGRRVLGQVGDALRAFARDFQVAGHTDSVPIHNAQFPSNWELSTARAVNVTHFLLERGFAADRLSAAGYADTQPVAANDNPAGRQQNRRTEIVLLPALNELPDLSPLQDLVH